MIRETLPTVRFRVRTPALAWLLLTLAADLEELVITSGSDGVHAPHSAHYRGEAIDIRVHDLLNLSARRARQARLQAWLGPDFDVVLEPDDVPGSTAAPHLHLQLRAGAPFSDLDLDIEVRTRWVTLANVIPPTSAA